MVCVKEFIEALQDAFGTEELTGVQDFFALPLVVYSIAGVTVLRTQEELIKAARGYRESLHAYGVVSTHFSVIEQDGPANKRSRVTVNFANLNEDGDRISRAVIRYFLIEREDGYAIEMMEYIEAPLPREDVERLAH